MNAEDKLQPMGFLATLPYSYIKSPTMETLSKGLALAPEGLSKDRRLATTPQRRTRTTPSAGAVDGKDS